MHHPNDQIRSSSRRPDRCLRHHVWMAACDVCRDVRADLLSSPADKGSAPTP
jgi:hypothetical protein